jgi:hypothetical protein
MTAYLLQTEVRTIIIIIIIIIIICKDKKVKFLCLTKHHAIETTGGVEV